MGSLKRTGNRISSFVKMLGPGLLYAGAAIGVSHLVQSTRAGAIYGFALIWAVILANVMKYPFFQFGPRYAAATGNSLIDGYRKLGILPMLLFLIITIGTIFTIQAAVTVVTGAIAASVFGIDWPMWLWSAIVLAIASLILISGRYKALDLAIKIIIVLLAVSTVSAAIIGISHSGISGHSSHFVWDKIGIAFLIALMGWMPSPIDLSVWHSLWSLEKNKQIGHRTSLKDALIDFNIGYWGTAVLALAFVTLGALIMFGSGTTFSPKGAVFAGQLISMYTNSLGPWAYIIIAVAALTTMFSTTLTCLDAIPRVLERSTLVIFPCLSKSDRHQTLYWAWLVVLVIGALLMLGFFINSMQGMVNLATILSFLTAPVLAVMNYLVMFSNQVPDELKPGKWMRLYALSGIVFLLGFAGIYIWSQWI